jgi:hypothetical protein
VPERTTFQGVAYSGEEITEMVLGFDIFWYQRIQSGFRLSGCRC